MNVLSLFNGMSCSHVALDKAKVSVDKYYASEIDKYAIEITQKNYPETVQLGDIRNIDVSNLPKIDLLTAGFPCQAWSVAGKQAGDTDPRGALVHDLIRVWRELTAINPDLKFIFENVKMKREFIDYINTLFGVEPIEINSSLLSAQSRRRLYWTNIKDVKQPSDRGIVLSDIIQDGFVDRDKSYCLGANYFKGTDIEQYLQKKRGQVVFNYSSSGRGNGLVESRYYDSGSKKAHCLTKTGYTKRSFTGVYNNGFRRLTPVECERLQTLPDNYTEGVSDTQRYKMLGNGATVDVLAHIFKNLLE